MFGRKIIGDCLVFFDSSFFEQKTKASIMRFTVIGERRSRAILKLYQCIHRSVAESSKKTPLETAGKAAGLFAK